MQHIHRPERSKTVVITGGSDGLGASAARKLAAMGAEVIIVGRNLQKTAEFARELHAPYYTADFSELAQVRKLAETLRTNHPTIDVLVNNAGLIGQKRTETVDDNEMTFQVNYLAPFLLTNLLHDVLATSKATVIHTSSSANLLARIHMNDLQSHRFYTAFRTYARTKLANLLFNQELHRRWYADGIASAAFHPGIAHTNFGNGTNRVFTALMKLPFASKLLNTPDQGSAPLVWLASSQPGVDWHSGGYYGPDCRSALANIQVHDTHVASQLWDESERLVGLQ